VLSAEFLWQNAKQCKDVMKDGNCPKCGSQDILPGAPIMDRSHAYTFDLKVEVFEKPKAILLKGRRSTGSLRAWICGKCGYTELFTDNHQELYNTFQRSKEQRSSR
jgi:ribosomal protein S27AE